MLYDAGRGRACPARRLSRKRVLILQCRAAHVRPGTAWHRKARRRSSDLIFLRLTQCTQEGMNTTPYKIISPRHNTVQRQVSGANLFYYRCSTLSLISAVRPWFQNWVPM